MGIFSLDISVIAAPSDNFTAVKITEGVDAPMAKMGARTQVENMSMKGLVTIVLNDVKKTITLNTNKKVYHEQPLKQHDKTF